MEIRMRSIQYLLMPLFCFGLGCILSSVSIAKPPNSSTMTNIMPSDMQYDGLYKNKKITLKDGQWSGSLFVAGGASRPTVGLIKDFTFSGDLTGDGIDERVVFLWQSSGGSGTQIYMAVLALRGGHPVNIATHLIGDRVQLVMGRVDQRKIELDVVQSGKDDAACCPTDKVLRTWLLKKTDNMMNLVEGKPMSLGRISVADLQGREWHLIKMNWRESVPENINISTTFKENKISGRSGCNRYFADIKSGKMLNDIIIGPAAGTRMACPGEAMHFESRFLKALSTVTSFSFVNGQLALRWKDDGVNSTMLFTAQALK